MSWIGLKVTIPKTFDKYGVPLFKKLDENSCPLYPDKLLPFVSSLGMNMKGKGTAHCIMQK